MNLFKNFYAFDFATSGNFEGICAAVLVGPDKKENKIWPKRTRGESYEKVLSPVELVQITNALIEVSEEGPLVGWGTLGYDLRLLFGEGIAKDEVVNLALNHYDLMFQIFSETGSMVSLGSVMYSTTLDQHLSKRVPELWNSGDKDKQDQVIQHTLNSANKVLNIAHQLLESEIVWMDYSSSSNNVTYKSKLTPCSNYIVPAMMLPPKVFNDKWSKTFGWIKGHAVNKARMEGLSSDRLDAMTMLKELA